MTQQVWVPHEETDGVIWRQGENTGTAIPVPALSMNAAKTSLSVEVEDIAKEHSEILEFEAFQFGFFPLFLTACRHYRLPIPPHLWFGRSDE